MNNTTEIHPDVVLESLVANGGRAQRQGNLAKLHEICRKQYEGGSNDFSLPVIGRQCETQDVLKARALYNAPSAAYRTLIAAWAAYAGPPAPKAPKAPKALSSHEYLMRIEDPAIRFIMQAIIAERDKLRAQINTLLAHVQVTVDRRPLGATMVSHPSAEPIAVLTMKAQLTPSEREALQKAISLQFLKEQGWHEGSHGEILNDRGRTLFEVGYARAIRKVLGD
jgi:hypothetical protein